MKIGNGWLCVFRSLFKLFVLPSDEKDAEMHYHDGEDALVCGDKFDDTVEESDKDTIMKEEGETKGMLFATRIYIFPNS